MARLFTIILSRLWYQFLACLFLPPLDPHRQNQFLRSVLPPSRRNRPHSPRTSLRLNLRTRLHRWIG